MIQDILLVGLIPAVLLIGVMSWALPRLFSLAWSNAGSTVWLMVVSLAALLLSSALVHVGYDLLSGLGGIFSDRYYARISIASTVLWSPVTVITIGLWHRRRRLLFGEDRS